MVLCVPWKEPCHRWGCNSDSKAIVPWEGASAYAEFLVPGRILMVRVEWEHHKVYFLNMHIHEIDAEVRRLVLARLCPIVENVQLRLRRKSCSSWAM